MFEKALFSICSIVALATPLYGLEWETDLSKALQRATEEKKAVLVDFTGSDWCSWCIKLRKEVLDTQAFTDFAQDKLVLLEIDLPRDVARIGGVAQARKNQEVCKRFRVDGFPTLLILSEDGVALKRCIGYRKLPALKTDIEKAIALNNKLLETNHKQGITKAETLLAIYHQLDPLDGAALLPQIETCDPDNHTGIREIRNDLEIQKQHANASFNEPPPVTDNAPAGAAPPELSPDDKKQLDKINQNFAAVGYNVDAQIKVLEEGLTSASPAAQFYIKRSLVNVLLHKIEILGHEARSVRDVYAMRPWMQKFVNALPPNLQPAAQKDIEDKFRNPIQTLIQLKQTYGAP